MHPLTSDALLAFDPDQLKRRIAFARRIGNQRVDARLLERVALRLYRELGGMERDAAGVPVPGAGAPQMPGNLPPAAPGNGPAPGPGKNPAPPPAGPLMPSTGARKTFALLIDFQDAPHHNSPQAIQQVLYGRPGPAAPYDSVAAYYDRASYHKLNLFGGTTLGWYRAPYPRTQVRQTDAARDQLIKEALKHFQAQGVDFSDYDTDHDGVVDFFYVLWAGADTGWGSFWWPYQPVFDDWNFTLNGVRFWRYAWMWESSPVGTPFDAATAIHETGHAIGLADYYDYEPAKGPPGGLGGLDMMDNVKYDHNCFSKWILDWLWPTIVTAGSKVVTLQPSGLSGDAVLVWPGTRSPAVFREFFLVQNRTRVANDVGLPNEGMLIWHVDARVTKGHYVCDNSSSSHKLLRLMEADGAEDIQAGRPADALDFYQPGMSFGPDTVPSSVGYGRRRSGVRVKDIHRQANGLAATFEIVAAGAPA